MYLRAFWSATSASPCPVQVAAYFAEALGLTRGMEAERAQGVARGQAQIGGASDAQMARPTAAKPSDHGWIVST